MANLYEPEVPTAENPVADIENTAIESALLEQGLVVVPFSVVSSTSQDGLCPAEALEQYQAQLGMHQDLRGWCTASFCPWPQELEIAFETCFRIDLIELVAHSYRIPRRIDIFVTGYQADCGPYYVGQTSFDSNLLQNHTLNECKCAKIDAYGTGLILRILDCYSNDKNLFEQANLLSLRVYGEEVPALLGESPAPRPRQNFYSEEIDTEIRIVSTEEQNGMIISREEFIRKRRYFEVIEESQTGFVGRRDDWDHFHMTEVDQALISIGIPVELVNSTATPYRIPPETAAYVNAIQERIEALLAIENDAIAGTLKVTHDELLDAVEHLQKSVDRLLGLGVELGRHQILLTQSAQEPGGNRRPSIPIEQHKSAVSQVEQKIDSEAKQALADFEQFQTNAEVSVTPRSRMQNLNLPSQQAPRKEHADEAILVTGYENPSHHHHSKSHSYDKEEHKQYGYKHGPELPSYSRNFEQKTNHVNENQQDPTLRDHEEEKVTKMLSTPRKAPEPGASSAPPGEEPELRLSEGPITDKLPDYPSVSPLNFDNAKLHTDGAPSISRQNTDFEKGNEEKNSDLEGKSFEVSQTPASGSRSLANSHGGSQTGRKDDHDNMSNSGTVPTMVQQRDYAPEEKEKEKEEKHPDTGRSLSPRGFMKRLMSPRSGRQKDDKSSAKASHSEEDKTERQVEVGQGTGRLGISATDSTAAPTESTQETASKSTEEKYNTPSDSSITPSKPTERQNNDEVEPKDLTSKKEPLSAAPSARKDQANDIKHGMPDQDNYTDEEHLKWPNVPVDKKGKDPLKPRLSQALKENDLTAPTKQKKNLGEWAGFEKAFGLFATQCLFTPESDTKVKALTLHVIKSAIQDLIILLLLNGEVILRLTTLLLHESTNGIVLQELFALLRFWYTFPEAHDQTYHGELVDELLTQECCTSKSTVIHELCFNFLKFICEEKEWVASVNMSNNLLEKLRERPKPDPVLGRYERVVGLVHEYYTRANANADKIEDDTWTQVGTFFEGDDTQHARTEDEQKQLDEVRDYLQQMKSGNVKGLRGGGGAGNDTWDRVGDFFNKDQEAKSDQVDADIEEYLNKIPKNQSEKIMGEGKYNEVGEGKVSDQDEVEKDSKNKKNGENSELESKSPDQTTRQKSKKGKGGEDGNGDKSGVCSIQ